MPEAQRPPPLKLGGHHHLWSWLIPVFKLSDGALLESAGLDALVGWQANGRADGRMASCGAAGRALPCINLCLEA